MNKFERFAKFDQLTGLEDFNKPETPVQESGKPLMIPVADIIPDPNQPRRALKNLDEMAASILVRGVRSPISVRSKNEAGKYVINFGHRRHAGSVLAGKFDIPAFIDDTSTSDDQMIENIQRDKLELMEIAEWVLDKESLGMKQTEISKSIGMHKTWANRFSKIGHAPVQMRDVSDKCTDYSALCDLIDAYEEFPEQILAYANAAEKIFRKEIAEVVKNCRDSKLVQQVDETTQVAQAAVENNGSEANDDGKTEPSSSGSANESTAAPLVNPEINEKPLREQSNTKPGEKPSASEKSSESATGAAPKQSKAGQREKSLVIDRDNVLQIMFTVQKLNGVPAIFEKFQEADLTLACEVLSEFHLDGSCIDKKDLATRIAKEFKSGVFSFTGPGLYCMMSFIAGVNNPNEEFTVDRMRNECFIASESVL